MKRFLFIGLVLIFASVLFSAIGAAGFTADAKRGFAWYFTNDHTKNWADYEAQFIAHLEAQGLEWNKQRLEANAARKAKIESIREALRGATGEQINAALTALGLN